MISQFSKLSIDITKQISNNDKKKQGIYFTPSNIIDRALELISNNKNIKNILEPSCGSCEIVKKIDMKYEAVIDCIEFNEIIYNNIKDLEFNNKVNIINDDFIKYKFDKTYDLIIGNPPYFTIKKDNIDNMYHKYFSGRPNIYIIFIIKSLLLLNDEGILCFVLPKNFLNCLYYNKLRKYIIENFKIMSIIECYDEKYIETTQDTILFILQKNLNFNNNEKYYIELESNIIFNTVSNVIKLNKLIEDSVSLHKLNFNVSVGNVVWNENKDILTNNSSDSRLIYSGDIKNNKLVLTTYKNIKKKNYIDKSGNDDSVLVINRGYGAGKYKFNYCLINIKNYLIENHLIVIKYNKKIKDLELFDLYNKIIKSFENEKTKEFIEIYFTNNAINTYELEYILPIFL